MIASNVTPSRCGPLAHEQGALLSSNLEISSLVMDAPSFAIEELYRVFARYPLRAHIHSCPHYQLDEAERRLHQAPLRALTVNQLSTFAFKAMTTFRDENDFRHFLPRLAELASLDGRSYEIPLIANKLVYGNWGEWPAEEQQAILGWLDALEDRALSAIASDDLESLLDARNPSSESCAMCPPEKDRDERCVVTGARLAPDLEESSALH